ncbi:MAG: hypothetical protein BECKG1743E_GA0114224_110521, partial [Candidatus Kentron sp. G]
SLQQTPASYGSQNVKLKIPSFGCPGYFPCLQKRLGSQVVLEFTLTVDDVIHLDIINACFGTSSKFYH